MTAQIISGRDIASEIKEELRQEIAELKEKHNLVPGLATVLVGENPASQISEPLIYQKRSRHQKESLPACLIF